MPAPRVLVLLASGLRAAVTAITASAGAGDADKVIATNAQGKVDDSFLNAGTTGASVLLKTKPDGTIDESVLPSGIGAGTATLTASEAIAAGEFVNVWNDAGTAKVRLADATTVGKECHGYVLESAASGTPATVYFDDRNTQVTGRTPGATQYLSTTPGQAIEDVSGYVDGNVVQALGVAYSATTIDFERGEPVKLGA